MRKVCVVKCHEGGVNVNAIEFELTKGVSILKWLIGCMKNGHLGGNTAPYMIVSKMSGIDSIY